MGYLQAYDSIDLLDGDLRRAVSLHFQSNCYPPVPQEMVEVALEAIHSVLVGDYVAPINLPEGVLFRGEETVTAMDAVESLFLNAFVDYYSEEEF